MRVGVGRTLFTLLALAFPAGGLVFTKTEQVAISRSVRVRNKTHVQWWLNDSDGKKSRGRRQIMKKQSLVMTLLMVVGSTSVQAATIEVGAGKKYASLAAAAADTRDGDTVVVYPGTYRSGAVWEASDITIRQPTGTAPGKAIVSGGTVRGKGLFVVTGRNVTIDGLRFQNAVVPDGNGAGIRAEGKNLTVRNSIFYNNEMGILATVQPQVGGTLTVENSRFDHQYARASGHIGHGLYVGNSNLEALIVKNSTFTRGNIGHYIKSRAPSTTVVGSTIDDTDGSGSFLIDVPEGGAVNITNNTLIKGANASNCCVAIALGFEMSQGYTNPPGSISITGNTFINKRAKPVTFVSNRTGQPAVLFDNVFTGGPVMPLAGAGSNNGVVS